MIDWARIDTLRDEVGPESFAEIAAMFLAEADTAVAGLSGGKAPRALAADLHAIKGSALNLGFNELSDLCARGEAAAMAGQPEHADLEGIRRAFASARAAFLARFPSVG